jgi:dihydrofolate reductase
VQPFKAIAAMSLNRVIGAGNKIPWHLPEDFRWFKKMTTGHVIVMGRMTFESIGKPLPNRTTIVLTRSTTVPYSEVLTPRTQAGTTGPQTPATELLTVRDLGELVRLAPDFTGRDIFICGGAQIYEQALPLCSDLYLTLVKRTVQGDAFFPPFEDKFDLAEELLNCAEFCISHYRKNSSGCG